MLFYIRGSLEALLDGIVTEPEKIDDYYLQMLNEAKFLQRLVNDLLDLSKLQSLDFVIILGDYGRIRQMIMIILT